jgi:hypothetical protein
MLRTKFLKLFKKVWLVACSGVLWGTSLITSAKCYWTWLARQTLTDLAGVCHCGWMYFLVMSLFVASS